MNISSHHQKCLRCDNKAVAEVVYRNPGLGRQFTNPICQEHLDYWLYAAVNSDVRIIVNHRPL